MFTSRITEQEKNPHHVPPPPSSSGDAFDMFDEENERSGFKLLPKWREDNKITGRKLYKRKTKKKKTKKIKKKKKKKKKKITSENIQENKRVFSERKEAGRFFDENFEVIAGMLKDTVTTYGVISMGFKGKSYFHYDLNDALELCGVALGKKGLGRINFLRKGSMILRRLLRERFSILQISEEEKEVTYLSFPDESTQDEPTPTTEVKNDEQNNNLTGSKRKREDDDENDEVDSVIIRKKRKLNETLEFEKNRVESTEPQKREFLVHHYHHHHHLGNFERDRRRRRRRRRRSKRSYTRPKRSHYDRKDDRHYRHNERSSYQYERERYNNKPSRRFSHHKGRYERERSYTN